MIRYLLLLKRLLKKKSYIVMLLVVPLMVLMLNAMSSADAGLMTIGVYIPGSDEASVYLQQDLEDNPGSFTFIFYDDEQDMIADVVSQKLTEGWSVPEDFDGVIREMAESGDTASPIQMIIREEGLTHFLAREVLSSRVYPLIARQIASDYITENLYQGDATSEQSSIILSIYDSYEINGNLFEMGYVDGNSVSDAEDNYLLMPLRGILALWLMLCAIAASMYYLEDEKNGLFIWWNSRFGLIRDLMYYLVIIIIPSIMVLIGLAYGGVYTNTVREVTGLLLYDLVIIVLANIIREIVGSIKALGILTPILILASAIFSPVFIDLKEARLLQKFFPTFNYLYCIHDLYYIKYLSDYLIVTLIIWIFLSFIKGRTK